MQYKYSSASGYYAPLLRDIENLMFFTYTGLKAAGKYDVARSYYYTDEAYTSDSQDDEGLFSERFSEGVDGFEIEKLWENLSANSYFSDISYYHVLNNNRIATKFFEAYVTPAGIPYFDQVLQSTNGNFYATDNYSFDNIKSTLEALIDLHKENREADDDLNKNLSNLESIINATDNKSGVLTELSGYRATYPNKSPTSFSGEFYGEFTVALAEIIQAVQVQEQLDVKQLYDSLVIDNRFSFAVGSYVPPDPSGIVDGAGPTSGIRSDDVIRGVPYSSPSGCYLPENWFYLTRRALLTDSISSYSEEELAELYGVSGDSTTFRDEISDESDALEKVMDELVESYVSEGFTEEAAKTLAREELSTDFSTGGGETVLDAGATRSELLNPTLNGGSYVDLRAGDAVVRHKGLFMFDYEKALRTQSIIAHVFDLTLLQKLFRINIPYSHFYVSTVELSRNELRLDATEIEPYHDKYIRSKLSLRLETPTEVKSAFAASYDAAYGEYYDYPHNKRIKYTYFGGKDAGEASSANEIFAQKIKYLRPSYNIGGTTYKSQLKFINFDLPTTIEEDKLKNYNSLDDISAAGELNYESFGPVATRVIDGYRVMAFKFTDVMDDDVAYYNTIDVGSVERAHLIEEANNLGEHRTCYSTVVHVVDQTQLSYDNFVNYIVSVYDRFVEYYARASDICSYNNITNEFNKFFIDQINEVFSADPVWTEAAYVANALGQLLFKSNETFDSDLFYENVLETVIRVSPETGNLYQLNSFAEQFKGLVDYITINDLGTTGGPPADSLTPVMRVESFAATDTPDGSYGRLIQFYNEKPIWEPISGDITPDDIPPPSVDTHALPEFVVPVGFLDPIDITEDEVPTFTMAGSDTLDDAAVRDRGIVFEGQIYQDWYGFESETVAGVERDSLGGISLERAVTNAQRVAELVFLPRSYGSSFTNALTAFYGIDELIFLGRDPGSDYYYTPDLTADMSISPGKFSDEPLEDSLTWAAYFINQIMSYSTTDVEVMFFNSPSYGENEIGRLRPGIDNSVGPSAGASSRKDYRNLVTCLAALTRLRAALNVMSSELGTASLLADYGEKTIFLHGGEPSTVYLEEPLPSFKSKEYEDKNNFFNFMDSSAASGDGAGLSLTGRRAEIHRQMIRRARRIVHQLINIVRNICGAEGFINMTMFYTYGLDKIVNPDDRFGPLEGTLGYSIGESIEINIDDLI